MSVTSETARPHMERTFLRPLGRVGAFVAGKVTKWQQAYIRESDRAHRRTLGELAKLRRGVGKRLEQTPELWAIALNDLPLDDAEMVSDEPTPEEVAAYTAITLFAMHQQSQDRPMHERGVGLGSAVRLLQTRKGGDGEVETAVRRRFEALGTASSFDEIAHHARGLIGQLRASQIPLDYGLFTDDLESLLDPARADLVRLRWGRDFYRRRPAGNNTEEPANEAAEDGAATTTHEEGT